MSQKNTILKGAFILTLAGFASRIIGFFYRIFLSHTIGAEGMGIYQLVFPIYTMALSLTSAGIQTAISRNVSAKMAVGNKKGARDTFIIGLILAFSASLLASLFLFQYADRLASSVLQEKRCGELIRLLAYVLPFSSIHSSICGYYYALKKTGIPAISQLVEQIVRVSSSYLIYLIMLEKGLTVGPVLAVVGMICADFAASLFCITAALISLRKDNLRISLATMFRPGKEILQLSLPLTINRALINLLQSAEAVLIPIKLQLSGLSNSAALSVYGVLTGMSLPLVLFPSAITSALSLMLLPTVSGAQASGDQSKISRTVAGTTGYSIILGILCTGVFLCFGQELGSVVFGDDSAGTFIVILAWICPFLYLSSTLTSILSGLGKTGIVFIQNAISLGLRILFVWFAIPAFGITGYLWGLLISQLFSAAASLIVLVHYAPFHFDCIGWIVKPGLTMIVSIGIMLFFRSCITFFNWYIPPVLEIMIAAAILCGIYILIVFHSNLTYFLKKQRY